MFATRKDITKHRKIFEITGWFSEITEAILIGISAHKGTAPCAINIKIISLNHTPTI